MTALAPEIPATLSQALLDMAIPMVYIVVLDELMTGVSKLRKAYSLQIGHSLNRKHAKGE
ncbi:MAG: hypothetical protein FRX49_06050 [Trebouxia sp. A1-2]|nr:MAG: hypothetical protein FRX49_06050 [Trebouxia sp. A1-2]